MGYCAICGPCPGIETRAEVDAHLASPGHAAAARRRLDERARWYR